MWRVPQPPVFPVSRWRQKSDVPVPRPHSLARPLGHPLIPLTRCLHEIRHGSPADVVSDNRRGQGTVLCAVTSRRAERQSANDKLFRPMPHDSTTRNTPKQSIAPHLRLVNRLRTIATVLPRPLLPCDRFAGSGDVRQPRSARSRWHGGDRELARLGGVWNVDNPIVAMGVGESLKALVVWIPTPAAASPASAAAHAGVLHVTRFLRR